MLNWWEASSRQQQFRGDGSWLHSCLLLRLTFQASSSSLRDFYTAALRRSALCLHFVKYVCRLRIPQLCKQLGSTTCHNHLIRLRIEAVDDIRLSDGLRLSGSQLGYHHEHQQPRWKSAIAIAIAHSMSLNIEFMSLARQILFKPL